MFQLEIGNFLLSHVRKKRFKQISGLIFCSSFALSISVFIPDVSKYGRHVSTSSHCSKVKARYSRHECCFLLMSSRTIVCAVVVVPAQPVPPCQAQLSILTNHCNKIEISYNYMISPFNWDVKRVTIQDQADGYFPNITNTILVFLRQKAQTHFNFSHVFFIQLENLFPLVR